MVARRGESSAGAIVIRVYRLDGTVRLLLPAPQVLTMDGDGGRYWLAAADGEPVGEAEAAERIAREIDFDPDLWVVDVEDRQGRDFLDGRLITG